MPLSPKASRLLARFEQAQVKQFQQLDVIESRLMVEASVSLQAEPPACPTEDMLVPVTSGSMPVRIYRGATSAAQPLLVYLHGGGWATGSVAVADRPCRALAVEARLDIASCEYRRSPETRFPGPLEDCYDALSWLAEHGERLGLAAAGVALCGDSAGGNLAAASAIVARDRRGPPIAFQVLMYPTLAQPGRLELPSYREHGAGHGLTLAELRWFWDCYLGEQDGRQRYASPLLEDDLSGLPPALIFTAECDLLRDEGAAYARRLREAGGSSDLTVYPGAIHGFFWMDRVLDEARLMRRDLAGWIAARGSAAAASPAAGPPAVRALAEDDRC